MPDNISYRDGGGIATKLRSFWNGIAHIPFHILAKSDGTAVDPPYAVKLQTQTSGGATPYRNLDVDETGVVVKAAAGQLYGAWLHNAHATDLRYLKIYDKATAPTAADTPKLTIPIVAGKPDHAEWANGIQFANGIGIRATTDLADAGVGAPGANEVVASLLHS